MIRYKACLIDCGDRVRTRAESYQTADNGDIAAYPIKTTCESSPKALSSPIAMATFALCALFFCGFNRRILITMRVIEPTRREEEASSHLVKPLRACRLTTS